MITQYTGSYSVPSTDIQNIVSSSIGFFDSYVLIQTGQYEYTALIKKANSTKVKQLKFTRSSTNSNWSVSRAESNDFTYTISNEFYTFSNMGFGRQLSPQIYDHILSASMVFICCVLSLAIMFKGVIFTCLRKSRH